MDSITIELKGKQISTQSIYGHTVRGRRPVRFMTDKAKQLKASYIQQIKSQYIGEIIEAPVEIAIRLVFGDKRKRDRDNFSKLSMDSLEGTILKDDSQIQKAYVEKFYEKGVRGIWIFIKELKNFNPALPSNCNQIKENQ